MNKFPEIEGITWVSDVVPDLVILGITLEDKRKQELDIPGLQIDDIPGEQYLDLTKLAGARHVYNHEGEIRKGESLVDVDGIVGFLAKVDIDDLVKAWIFCKEFHYATRNI